MLAIRIGTSEYDGPKNFAQYLLCHHILGVRLPMKLESA